MNTVFVTLFHNDTLYLHGISFFPRSRQQKHDTPQAMTTMRITDTHPTIKSSFKLIWQFLPANHARHSQLTWESWLITHWPFLLHRSHSVVVAKNYHFILVSYTRCILYTDYSKLYSPKIIKHSQTYLNKLCLEENLVQTNRDILPCIYIRKCL